MLDLLQYDMHKNNGNQRNITTSLLFKPKQVIVSPLNERQIGYVFFFCFFFFFFFFRGGGGGGGGGAKQFLDSFVTVTI